MDRWRSKWSTMFHVLMRNTVITIFGRKGSGKSFLTKEITEDHDRVLALDSLGEYGREHKFEVFTDFDSLVDRLVEAEEEPTFRISARLVNDEEALDTLRVAREISNQLIVIEEASLYCSPTQLPEEIAWLIRYGRHQEIDLIFVARRPSEVNRDVTAQSDIVVTFQQREPRDVVYLRSMFGVEAEKVKDLPEFQPLVFGDLEHAPRAVLRRVVESGQLQDRAQDAVERVSEDIEPEDERNTLTDEDEPA